LTRTSRRGESRKIATQTLADVQLLWKHFKAYYDSVILSIYDYPRYEGDKLRDKVQEGYMLVLVTSGLANKSPSVKRSMPTVCTFEGDYLVCEVQGLRYAFLSGGGVTVPKGHPLHDKLAGDFTEN
jgi:hypothetical protein